MLIELNRSRPVISAHCHSVDVVYTLHEAWCVLGMLPRVWMYCMYYSFPVVCGSLFELNPVCSQEVLGPA